MMENLHYIQMQILNKLLFCESLGFAELNMIANTAEVTAYHLKKLQQLGFVNKSNDTQYQLTIEGKKFAANINIENGMLEERAKLSIICVVLKNEELLVIERLKSPLRGTVCCVAGKVRYGESMATTVARELQEETGVTAKKLEFRYFFRQFVYDKETKKFLKDNSFCVFLIEDFKGKIKDSVESRPFLVRLDKFKQVENKAYDLDEIIDYAINPPESRYVEKYYEVNNF